MSAKPSQFSEILLIVHPGFHVAKRFLSRIRNSGKAEPRLKTEERAFLEEWFGKYGRLILESKANPERFVALVNTRLFDSLDSKAIEKLSPKTQTDLFFLKRKIEEFTKLAKRGLKERIQIFDGEIKKEEVYAFSDKFNPRKKIKIIGAGEWEKQCLHENTSAVESSFRDRGFRVKVLPVKDAVRKGAPITRPFRWAHGIGRKWFRRFRVRQNSQRKL